MTIVAVSDASFERLQSMVPSSWIEHGPFAFWIVEAHRPRCLVELGTHNGYSYFCFCQKVRDLGLGTRCFAVDSWTGDEHSGFYGEHVFEAVVRYQELQRFDFSRLLRKTFDEAVGEFADGSIDLLHIDGRHFYEDVKHDFETWLPKLSDRAVVLFHDTQVREQGFGVFRFWEEISRQYPHFEFTHCYGLGVLGVGHAPEVAQLPIFRGEDPEAVRSAYARLGSAITGKPLSRNEPCPCGSTRRFKHCHGSIV